MKKNSINLMNAKAFVLEKRMEGLKNEEILEAARRTVWIADTADIAFKRIPHTPTIRRLVRRLLGL